MSILIKERKFTCDEIIKPCKVCGYCPYGDLVEEFPPYHENDEHRKEYICQVFKGCECPVFYLADGSDEFNDGNFTDKEMSKMDKTLDVKRGNHYRIKHIEDNVILLVFERDEDGY